MVRASKEWGTEQEMVQVSECVHQTGSDLSLRGRGHPARTVQSLCQVSTARLDHSPQNATSSLLSITLGHKSCPLGVWKGSWPLCSIYTLSPNCSAHPV